MAHEPIAIAVRTDDGWLLRGEHFPRPDAKAVAVLGHAMMVDRRTLDRPRGEGLASVLFRAGLEVVTLDARGHGESGPRASEGARWSYDDIVRFDVPAHVRIGREVAGGRPVALVGHSLIGHAGLIAAGLRPESAPDALVAFAPNLWSPSLEPSFALRLAKGGLVRAWSTWSRARGYFDARALGMGSDAEAEPYVTQFEHMWRDDHLAARGGDSYEEALGRAALPVLAFSSERDRLLGRPASVERFVRLAPHAAVVHERVIDRATGPAPSHMGFVTDPRSRDLWERAARWILETIG